MSELTGGDATDNATGGEPINEGVSNTGSWMDALPENIREWDEVKNSDSPEKFYDQISNMRSMMGKSIRIPTEDAGEEARQAFIDKLKTVPGVMMKPSDEAQLTEFLGGMDAEQKKAAYNLLKGDESLSAEDRAALDKQLDDEIQTGLSKLRDEWGNAYARNVQAAKNAVKLLDDQMGDNRVVKALDATGAGNHPDMIALFAKVGEMLGERPAVDGGSVNTFTISPAEARERIAEIEGNPMYWDSKNKSAERKLLIEKKSKYYAIAYPDEQ